MMAFYCIIFLILLMFCFSVIRSGLIKLYKIYGLEKTIRDFIKLYYEFEKVWEQDIAAVEVLRMYNLENNCLKIGVLNDMTFQNMNELRQCMLRAGEFIVKYSEIMENQYNYDYETEEFTDALQVLITIRRVCMEKGENAIIV